MYQLNNLTPLVKKRKRVGRGGKLGGTSGRGHKGQRARTGGTGKNLRGFEGGQMPLARRLPKRGFNNARFAEDTIVINIQVLNDMFETNAVITKELLAERGIVKNARGALIKVLGDGELSKKLIVHTDLISKSAQKAIEDLGGQVHLTKEK